MDLEKELERGESEGFELLKMPTSAPPETFCKYLEHVPPKTHRIHESAESCQHPKIGVKNLVWRNGFSFCDTPDFFVILTRYHKKRYQ